MKDAYRAMHRRAQRAESETCRARREAIGQRRRGDFWRRYARSLESFVPQPIASELAFNASIEDFDQ